MQVAFKAANGQYVCAEGGGGRAVVANRSAVGPWETFEMSDLGGGRVSLRAANGMYVCAEGGGGRAVVANRSAAGPWETFQRVDVAPGRVALRASNGQYVCAEGSGGREVVANRDAVGAWETFELIEQGVPQGYKGVVMNYDVAISMDEAGFNRIIATLFTRPRLRDSLFKGSETGVFTGVNASVSWEVLQAPTLVLAPPTPEQWGRSIKQDGTTPQPTQNAFIARFPKMKVARQATTGNQETTISLDAVCAIGLNNNELSIAPVAAIVDLSTATPLDRLIFTKVIIPKVLQMADSMLSGRQIPSIDFKGLSFGSAALAVGNGRMVGVANLLGKPSPGAPNTGDFPGGSFYILLSPEALQKVADAGTQGLRGRSADTSGSEGFGIGKANYRASIRLDNVSSSVSPDDLTVVSASVGVAASASAGVDVFGVIGGAIVDTANQAGDFFKDTGNKIADAFSSY